MSFWKNKGRKEGGEREEKKEESEGVRGNKEKIHFRKPCFS